VRVVVCVAVLCVLVFVLASVFAFVFVFVFELAFVVVLSFEVVVGRSQQDATRVCVVVVAACTQSAKCLHACCLHASYQESLQTHAESREQTQERLESAAVARHGKVAH